jgi:hypothetical protein
VNSDFGQSGFRSVVFLWFTLVGIESDAAEVSAYASASVISPVSVNAVIADLWIATFMSDSTAGRRIIRIPGSSLSTEARGGDGNTSGNVTLGHESGLTQLTLADLSKLIASNGTLSGDIISTLTVGSASMMRGVTVMVEYN